MFQVQTSLPPLLLDLPNHMIQPTQETLLHPTHVNQLAKSTEPLSVSSCALRKIHEQEKRRQSIIVKGLKASSASDFKIKFGQLCDDVMGVKVDLSDVKSIPGHPNIFRAKVVHDTQHKLILDNAKRLKGSVNEFNLVYLLHHRRGNHI